MSTFTFTQDSGDDATTDSIFQDASGHLTESIADPMVTLHSWADKGWLRRLDSALAAFMRELDPTATTALLVSTAVLAQMEGRGNTCLPLRQLVTQPNAILAWSAAAQKDLNAFWKTLPANLPSWLAALQCSPLVRLVSLERAGDAIEDELDHGQPLVLSSSLDEPLLYLRRYWLYERQVAHDILQRTAESQPVDETLARQWLDRLFDPTDSTATDIVEVDWQKLACAVALRANLTVITGGPGTGKTYTAARLLALLFAMHVEPQRLRVALAAPTGKAAARLRQSIAASLQELDGRLGDKLDLRTLTRQIGIARTLHSLLGARPDTRVFRFNASHLLDVDILIVDEASMVHLEMMSALTQAMPRGAKLILLGDKDQLASVEAGAVLGDLCRESTGGRYNQQTARFAQAVAGQVLPAEFLDFDPHFTALAQQTVMLRKSQRFGGLIGQLALAVNGGHSDLALQLITSDKTGVLQASHHPNVKTILDLAVQGRPEATACYADYLRLVGSRPADIMLDVFKHDAWVKTVLVAFDRFRILCVVHEGKWGTKSLNQGVQDSLAEAGLLNPQGDWFAGRPVMVTRNDAQLGIFNGDVGVTLPSAAESSVLRVYFLDGNSLRSVGVSRLAHVETAFAMTVHKSQGSEFLHTALVLPAGGTKGLTREMVYTGITRARERFTLIEGQPGSLNQAIKQQSQRASGLGLQL